VICRRLSLRIAAGALSARAHPHRFSAAMRLSIDGYHVAAMPDRSPPAEMSEERFAEILNELQARGDKAKLMQFFGH
jgi:hypothetical protein